MNIRVCLSSRGIERPKSRALLLIGASILSFTAASPALAQTASSDATPADSADSNKGIEDIVVTAQRRGQNLQEVPIAVSAFSEDSLTQRGVATVRDLGNVESGLKITSDSGTVMPFLRGIGNQSANLIGNEASVPVYIDEVYYTRTSPVYLEVNNIERVEVLKGPQGTLFGRNSSGGLIHIVTRDPDFDAVHLDARVGYASYQTVTGKLYFSVPIAERTAVDLSVSGLDQNDGWGKNLVTGKDTYRQKFINVRSKLVTELGDSTKIKLIGFYSWLRSAQFSLQDPVKGTVSGTNPFYGPAQPLPSQADGTSFYDIASDVDPFDRFESWGGSLRIEQGLGFADAVSITSYRKANEYYVIDGDLSSFNFLRYKPKSIDREITQELQLKSKSSSKIDWILGGFYLDSKQGYNPTTITGDAFGAFGLQQQDLFGVQRIHSYAVYGQATAPIAENTNLTLGLRYTSDKVNGQGRQEAVLAGSGVRFPLPAALGGQDPYDKTFNFKRLTYRATLDHKFDDALVYATVSRGYKSGTFNTLPLNQDPSRPEIVDAYELGVKAGLFDNRVRINAALFQNDIKNPQVQALTVIGNTTFVGLTNAKKARSRGGEITIDTIVADGLRARFGATILDPKYLDFKNAVAYFPIVDASGNPTAPYGNQAGVIVNASGNTLARVSKVRLNGGLNYTAQTNAGEFTFDVNADYSSRMYWEPNNVLSQAPYVMINSTLQFHPANNDQFTIQIWGKNLTNKKIYSATLAAPGPLGTQALASAPRTYGIELGYKF